MILSDISVKRPVFASVISLLLLAFGILSFMELPLREYPDTSAPVVSINTSYPGASAAVVESQITQMLEEQINGVEGVNTINSSSRDGSSNISVEFHPGRDIEVGANDIRERIARVTNRLPDGVDPPRITKADSDARPIMFMTLVSDELSYLELNDYANRFIVDQFAVVDGVATAQVRGNGGYAMRVWLDRSALAARQLTVLDVENALRRENIEVPAGRIESSNMEFSVQVERIFQSAEDFRRLVIGRGADGHLITLGEVARVELGSANERGFFRANGQQAVGIGIIRQSTANSLAVMHGVMDLAERINPTLPDHMRLVVSSSDAVFIENAISSVYQTIFLTMVLVSLVIYMFLGSIRTMLVPVITIPVCLISSFIVLAALGLSINLITLLALVLSVGLIVDDSIVVLENIQRRVESGEAPLLAAYNGARQVGFAVVATTVVLIAVFVPVIFMEGTMGILLFEMAATIGGAVIFSTLLALTLAPMLSSKLLNTSAHQSWLTRGVDRFFRWLQRGYHHALAVCLRYSWGVVPLLAAVGIAIYLLLQAVPSVFSPVEDQGSFFVMINGPEGVGIDYMETQVNQMQTELQPYIDSGIVTNVITMVPGFGGGNNVNRAIMIITLPLWHERDRSTTEIMNEIRGRWANIPAVQINTFMRSGLVRGGGGQPVQFVLGGRSYDEIAEWRDHVIAEAEASGMFLRLDSDYNETQPSLSLRVDRDRAADLGVSIQAIGRTLQAMMNESRITTFASAGEEYDVIIQAEGAQRSSPDDLSNIFVRSDTSGRLIPLGNLVTVENTSGPDALNRYNRIRSITISANLAAGVTLEEGLSYLEHVVATQLPDHAQVGYKGESLDLKEAGGDLVFIFMLALLVVFLVLAAQFESFIHPLVIMTTVPLALFGALLGLYLTGGSLNIYTNIGLVILVGIASKNGILIVEFANQLRDQGKEFNEALVEACDIRLRPVLMTALSTLMGTVPLIIATGAGSESRILLGTVIFSGVTMTTLMTLFVVPVVYKLLAKNTSSPETVARMLRKLQQSQKKSGKDYSSATGLTQAG